MEDIKKITFELKGQLEPTLAVLLPLLEKNKEKITSVPKQSFRFGKTERHFLDVYYPENTPAAGGKAPILFFVYGGGFTTGDRNAAHPFHLWYSSIGAFFALHGFITILPDYRLAPEFKYPSAAEDVIATINWAISNPSHLISGSSPSPDLDFLVVSGHSAGAVHAATVLYHQGLIPVGSDLRRRIKAVVLMGGPAQFLPGGGQKEMAEAHWGSEANAAENSPNSLLLSWISNNSETKLPKILITQAENEPRWIYDSAVEHRRLLEWHLGESVDYVEGKGHNHTSLICCLSTGAGEEWGTETANWIRNVFCDRKAEITSTGPGILEDVEETDAHECPKCQKRKARSFEVKLGTQNILSKRFASCINCGNKWSW